MGKNLKISRIKLRDRYYNVITGNRRKLASLASAIESAISGETCPVLVISEDKNDVIIATEKDAIDTDKCNICEGEKSCPVSVVLKTHLARWDKHKGKVSKKEKPRKTSKNYVKINVE